MPMTHRNSFTTRSSILSLAGRVCLETPVELVDPPVELVEALVEPVDTLVEPVEALVELVDALDDPLHQLEQAPKNALNPNQRGSDLFHFTSSRDNRSSTTGI